MDIDLSKTRALKPLLKEGRLRLAVPQVIKDTIETIRGAYRSQRSAHPRTYISTPITSGKRLYDALDRHDVRTLEALCQKNPAILRDEVLLANIAHGKHVADRIAQKSDGAIICPALFDAKRLHWSQDAYMLLWYVVIEEFVTRIILTDDWQYSNGCAQEFVRAHELQCNFALTPRHAVSYLPVYQPRILTKGSASRDPMEIADERLNPLTLHDGARALSSAIVALERDGYCSGTLRQSLYEIGGIAECYEWHHDNFSLPFNIDYDDVYQSVQTVRPEFAPSSHARNRFL